MLRTWIGPTELNYEPRNGLWQTLRERDDRQNFYHAAPTKEEAAAGLEKFLDDETYPMPECNKKALDDYQREHGVPLPPRWYPELAQS